VVGERYCVYRNGALHPVDQHVFPPDRLAHVVQVAGRLEQRTHPPYESQG